MKRNLLIGIIGLASTVSVLSQGHILISNYLVPPYKQVVWDFFYFDVGGRALTDPDVPIEIWYADGLVSDPSSMQLGATTSVNPLLTYDPGAGYGPGGYFSPVEIVLPSWGSGDVFTFQLRIHTYG